MFALNKRWVIDGSPRWNVARYINHACRPNAKPVGRKGGIVIVALRRIEPDEEITYDYGREYLKSFLPDGGCRCAACRRKQAQQRMRMSSKRRAKLASQHRSIIDNYANRDEKPRLSRSSVANKRFQRLSSCN